MTDKQVNMAEAGRVAAIVQDYFKKAIKPGISLLELDAAAEKLIIDHGAIPAFKGQYDFPNSVCISVNDQVVHGIPSEYKLQEGDIVSLDIGAIVNGYYSDCAATYAVGPISHDKKKLMDVTAMALQKALAVVKEGVRVGDISHAICSYVYENKMSIPEEFSGHGIGRSLHEEPYVFNIGKPNTGKVLKAGDTIAIEPIVILGKPQIRVEADDWTAITMDGTPSAHFEHTIEITQEGYKVLTSLDQKEVKNG